MRFHKDPDGAAVFPKSDGDDGWYYVSNAEEPSVGTDWMNGGVGAIEFDGNGRVVGYARIADRLRQNCGGGKTPWNSWVTCEEIGGGKVSGTVGERDRTKKKQNLTRWWPTRRCIRWTPRGANESHAPPWATLACTSRLPTTMELPYRRFMSRGMHRMVF